MLIDIKDLSFAYDGSAEPIFENLNLQIDTSWKLGFIGRNGYGKTTFLKLLRNELEYTGKITSSLEFEYFPYTVNSELITEDAILEKFPEIELWQLECELSLLNVDDNILRRPFNTLSNGEQIKVLLSAMFVIENRFLLIDEPTNHLDSYGRKTVAEYLNSKNGFILVSHDRNFLNKTVDHILVIEKNNIEVQNGNYDSWNRNRINRDNLEMQKNKILKKDIRRLKDSTRRTEGWANLIEKSKGVSTFKAKGRKMMQRAKNIERNADRAIERKEKLLKNIERVDSIPMHPLVHHAKNIIQATSFSIKYDDKQIFKEVDFELVPNNTLVINEKNGAGKSSILKLLIQELTQKLVNTNSKNIEFSGSLKFANDLKVSFVPQDFTYLNGSLFEFIEDCKLDKTKFLTTLRKLNFPRHIFEYDMSTYSAGQKKKVLLTKSICEEAHLYIWDEPLNYIDIDSRIQIEEMLLQHKPTLILVEHDKEFTKNHPKLVLETFN